MKNPVEDLKLVKDPGARTQSYYCGADSVMIDDAVIAWLKEKLAETAGNTVRICLHREASSPFHEMLIAHKPSGRFLAHKHLVKSESYHVIEGRLRVNRYDDEGRRILSEVLGPKGSGLAFLHRIPVGVWHSTEPDGDFVVFHESKPGPFVASDNVYPAWK